jgi:hypothetical protein
MNNNSFQQKVNESDAAIQKVPNMNGAYVEFPYDFKQKFGKRRVNVSATFDGYPYEGSLVRTGTLSQIIGIRKEINTEIKKQRDDLVQVTIRENPHKNSRAIP